MTTNAAKKDITPQQDFQGEGASGLNDQAVEAHQGHIPQNFSSRDFEESLRENFPTQPAEVQDKLLSLADKLLADKLLVDKGGQESSPAINHSSGPA